MRTVCEITSKRPFQVQIAGGKNCHSIRLVYSRTHKSRPSYLMTSQNSTRKNSHLINNNPIAFTIFPPIKWKMCKYNHIPIHSSPRSFLIAYFSGPQSLWMYHELIFFQHFCIWINVNLLCIVEINVSICEAARIDSPVCILTHFFPPFQHVLTERLRLSA